MKTKLNPTLVGMFALGTLALVVVALLSFRSRHWFSKPERFVAYFNESVQGLDVGGAVKLRGVRIGQVRSIRVQHDSATRRSRVVVVSELDQKVITDQAGQVIKLADRATLQRLIEEGLRARIDLVGITGIQFVELDFLDPQQLPAAHLEAGAEAEYPVVPTVRSGMSELIGNLSKIVSNLHRVDFASMARELDSLLASANRQVGELDLKRMVAKVTAAAESIEALAGSAEAKEAFAHLNQAATGVQTLAGRLEAEVEPVRSELVRSLRAFHDAADGIHTLLGPGSDLGGTAARTLRQMTETAESLQQLAEFLERNPNALITGRKRPGMER